MKATKNNVSAILAVMCVIPSFLIITTVLFLTATTFDTEPWTALKMSGINFMAFFGVFRAMLSTKALHGGLKSILKYVAEQM